jgi:hypothetical protein
MLELGTSKEKHGCHETNIFYVNKDSKSICCVRLRGIYITEHIEDNYNEDFSSMG